MKPDQEVPAILWLQNLLISEAVLIKAQGWWMGKLEDDVHEAL